MRCRFILFATVILLVLQLSDTVTAQRIAVTDLGPVIRMGRSVHAAGSPSTSQTGRTISGSRHERQNLEDLEEAAADETFQENVDFEETYTGRRDQRVESPRVPKRGLRFDAPATSTRASTAPGSSQAQRNYAGKDVQPRSEEFRHSAVGVSARQRQWKEYNNRVSVRDEEEKLQNATIRLVTWLRNRLRKRLNDVAMLESEMQTEKIVLQNLNESIANTTSERENEIRRKIKAQKKLSEFRQKVDDPERQLRAIQTETKKLSDNLAHLGEMYNSLAERRRKLRQKLHEAGFSHWLDMRGKEYLPDTAVGVLSKSAELFEPFSHDLQQAVNLDRKFAATVEGVIPKLSEQTLFGKVVEEFLMLLPIVPLLMVVCRLFQTLHTLSILHLVMYGAIGFILESCLLLLVSAVLGRETIRALQEVKHSTCLTAGLFINALMYLGYMFTQALISVLAGSRFEMLQTILSLAIGHHYYWAVFRPVMLDENVRITAVGHLMSVVIFCLVAHEKKKTLQLQAPYEDEINELLLSIEGWMWETLEAMGNVFRERSPEINLYNEEMNIPSVSSISPKETYIARSEKVPTVLEPKVKGPPTARRGYGRWTGARVTTGVRKHNARAFAFNSPNRQGPSIVQSGSRQRTPLMRSESGTSTEYGSCGE